MRKPKLCFEVTALLLCLHFLVGLLADPEAVVPPGTDYDPADTDIVCPGTKDEFGDCVKAQEREIQGALKEEFVGRNVRLDKGDNVVYDFLFAANSSETAAVAAALNVTWANVNKTIGKLLRGPEGSSIGKAVVRANAYSLRYCYYEATVNGTGCQLWCGELKDNDTTTSITNSTTSTYCEAVQMSPDGQQVFYTDGTGIWVTNLKTMHSALLVATNFPVMRFHVDWKNARAFTVEAGNLTGGSSGSNLTLTSWDLQRPPTSLHKPSVQVWATSNSTIKSITAEPRTKSLYWKVDNGSILKVSYNVSETMPIPRVILQGKANASDGGDFQGAPMMINKDTLIYATTVSNASPKAVQLKLDESVSDVIYFRDINSQDSRDLEMTAFYSSDGHSITSRMNESCHDCSHLCVPVGLDESGCTCPYEFELEGGKDSKNCKTPEKLIVALVDTNAEWILADFNVMSKALVTLASSESKMTLIPYFGPKHQVCYQTENDTNITCVGESTHVLKPLSRPEEVLAIASNRRSEWSLYWLDSNSSCLKEVTHSSSYTMFCDQQLLPNAILTRFDPTRNLLFFIDEDSRISVIHWPTREIKLKLNLSLSCASNRNVDFDHGYILTFTCGSSVGHLNYTNLDEVLWNFSSPGVPTTTTRFFEDADQRQWYLSSGAIYTKPPSPSSVAYKIYGLHENLQLQYLQPKHPLSYEDYRNTTTCSHFFEVVTFPEGPRFNCYCPYELPTLHKNQTCGSIKLRILAQEGSEYHLGLYDSNSGFIESYLPFTEKPTSINSFKTRTGDVRSCYVDRSKHLKCTDANGSPGSPHLDVSSHVIQLVKPNKRFDDELYWLQTDKERNCLYFSNNPSVSQMKLRCLDVTADHEIVTSTLDVITMTLFWCQKDTRSARGTLQWLSLKHGTSSKTHPEEIECMGIALSNFKETQDQKPALYISTSTSIKVFSYDLKNATDTIKSPFIEIRRFGKDQLKTTQVTETLIYFDNYLLWVQEHASQYQYQVQILDLASNKPKAQHMPIISSNSLALQFDVAQAPSRITELTSPCETSTCEHFCIPYNSTDSECWCPGTDGAEVCRPATLPPSLDTSTSTTSPVPVPSIGTESTTTTRNTEMPQTTAPSPPYEEPTTAKPIPPYEEPTTSKPIPIPKEATTPEPDVHPKDEDCDSSTWIWILVGGFFGSIIVCAVCFRCLVKRPDEPRMQWSKTLAYFRAIPGQLILRLRSRGTQSYDAVKVTEPDSLKLDAQASGALETTV